MKKIIVAVLLLCSVFVANLAFYNNKKILGTISTAISIETACDVYEERIPYLEKSKEELEKDNAVLSEKNNILELENQKIKQSLESISKFKTGEIITFGKYPYAANGKEMPIEWIILDRKGSKALLISRYGLDYKQYNDKVIGKNIGWANSTIRKWLNGDFMNKAFSNKEKQSIVKTFLSTIEYDTYFRKDLYGFKEYVAKYSYKNTYDFVFLNYEFETGNLIEKYYFPPTPYANKLSSSSDNCAWDIYIHPDFTGVYNKCNGCIYYPHLNKYAFVLPSMWIDLKKAFPDYPQQSLEQLLAAQTEPKTEIETAQENPAKEK